MEENKQKGTSPSFTNELFGSKESHPIFGSMFSPPSQPKLSGRESLSSELSGNKTAKETWSPKTGTQDDFSKGKYGEAQNTGNKNKSYMYQHQRVPPCPLSSSIYYGGQDTYYHSSTENEGLNSTHKNDVGNDDPGIASRGNWWQGSLYY